MFRFHTFPRWLKRFYPEATWDYHDEPGKNIYLTFDDGPNPNTTPWLLDLLDQHQAHATFFCLGKNATAHPVLFNQLTERGHSVGNHGMQHLNGFHTDPETYVADALQAKQYIPGNLFRPAYGKMTRPQFKALKQAGFHTVFWSLIPYDFDAGFSPARRLRLLRKKTKSGSILVFHDSEKAFPQLEKELPVMLREWQDAGYTFKKIS